MVFSPRRNPAAVSQVQAEKNNKNVPYKILLYLPGVAFTSRLYTLLFSSKVKRRSNTIGGAAISRAYRKGRLTEAADSALPVSISTFSEYSA
jgi:hypothetical protein